MIYEGVIYKIKKCLIKKDIFNARERFYLDKNMEK